MLYPISYVSFICFRILSASIYVLPKFSLVISTPQSQTCLWLYWDHLYRTQVVFHIQVTLLKYGQILQLVRILIQQYPRAQWLPNVRQKLSVRIGREHKESNCIEKFPLPKALTQRRLFMGPLYTGPKSLKVNSWNLSRWEHGRWDLPLHMGSQVISPKYDVDAYMATLFGGKTWDLCWELSLSKRLNSTFNRSPDIFLHKITKIRLQWI